MSISFSPKSSCHPSYNQQGITVNVQCRQFLFGSHNYGDESRFSYCAPENEANLCSRRDETLSWKEIIKIINYKEELKHLCQAIKRERSDELSNSLLLQYDNARPPLSSKTVPAVCEFGFE